MSERAARALDGQHSAGIMESPAGQSGSPMAWGNIIYTGNYSDIPLAHDQRTVSQWFNVTSGFVRTTSQQLASNIRTFPRRLSNVRSPGIGNFDLSGITSTKIREKVETQFRAEFLNAFNHPYFSAPNLTPTSNAFGTITGQSNNSRRIQLSLKVLF